MKIFDANGKEVFLVIIPGDDEEGILAFAMISPRDIPQAAIDAVKKEFGAICAENWRKYNEIDLKHGSVRVKYENTPEWYERIAAFNKEADTVINPDYIDFMQKGLGCEVPDKIIVV